MGKKRTITVKTQPGALRRRSDEGSGLQPRIVTVEIALATRVVSAKVECILVDARPWLAWRLARAERCLVRAHLGELGPCVSCPAEAGRLGGDRRHGVAPTAAPRGAVAVLGRFGPCTPPYFPAGGPSASLDARRPRWPRTLRSGLPIASAAASLPAPVRGPLLRCFRGLGAS